LAEYIDGGDLAGGGFDFDGVGKAAVAETEDDELTQSTKI
jgi:hypothetical protein